MTARMLADPVRVAVFGTISMALVIAATMNLSQVPFLNAPTQSYSVQLANTGGLAVNDDVKISGVSAGKVTDIEVVGAHVVATFEVERRVTLGSESSARVEVATALGAVYLQITSNGTKDLPAGSQIPVARSSVPFTLVGAFESVGDTVADMDLPSMRRSLGLVEDTLDNVSSEDVAATLRGLTTISTALESRSTEITALLESAQEVTDKLNEKSATIVQLLGNANSFLEILVERREVVLRILQDTSQLAADLRALVNQNQDQLSGALGEVTKVLKVLTKKDRDLRRSIQLLGQFTGNIQGVTGNGPWLDLFLPTSLIPDNVIGRCGASPKQGCGN